MNKQIRKILNILDSQKRKQLLFIFFLLIIISILETLGVGLILPILSLIFSPDVESTKYYKYLINLLNFETKKELLLFTTYLFFFTYLFKNIFLILFNYLRERFSNNITANFATYLFSFYLEQSLFFHANTNSSKLIRNINNEMKILVKSYLLSFINITLEILVLFLIFLMLMATNWQITIIITVFLIFITLILSGLHRRSLKRLGELRMKYVSSLIKILQQSFASIKEIKINFLENYLAKNYFKNFNRQGKLSVLVGLFSSLPKSVFEIIVVILICSFLIFFLKNDINALDHTALFGFYLAAFYRLIPSLNRTINNIQSIRYSKPSFEMLYEELKTINQPPPKKMENAKIFNFKKEIFFKNVDFKFEKNKNFIFQNVNFSLKKNTFTGIIGATGSGKSSLLNIFLGFYEPIKGKIFVDNENNKIKDNFEGWIKLISYVPQSVYIYDDTIASNITFKAGNGKSIDYDLLNESLKFAELNEFVNSLRDGVNTIVGEFGEKLSGGQRQRIGIARVFYKNNEIMVFDEATNALDEDTERKIFSNLEKIKNKKTIIFVSHSDKISSLCDQVIKIENNKVNILK